MHKRISVLEEQKAEAELKAEYHKKMLVSKAGLENKNGFDLGERK